jgi:hypothetical protein
MKRPGLVLALSLAALGVVGCNDKPLEPKVDAGTPPAGLTQEQAARTLAKVGDEVITLGDFAATLERMDQFDRLRYQTKERRRELLDEIIDVELLAREAKKRGLDQQPDTQEAVRQVLRDALLADTRSHLPAPAEIPAEEVRAYYESHADKFHEPERRRVAAVVMTDAKEAAKVLEKAVKVTSATQWGELVQKHSLGSKGVKITAGPVDLAGDLGIVGPPSDDKGANPRVPEPVRAAVFQIGNVGAVYDKLVEVEGKQYIVRMNGITAGHTRTLAEADRGIRVMILQEKMQANEQALETELRKKFPVEIDDKALAGVKLPDAIQKMDATSGASRMPPAAPDASAEPAKSDGGK